MLPPNKIRMMTRVAVAVTLLMCAKTTSLDAQTPSQRDINKIEQQLDTERQNAAQARARAEIMGRDIQKLQEDMVVTAQAVQRHEEQVAAVRARLEALGELTSEKEIALARDRASFGRVLAAMQRIAQFPPEALIAQPQQPADTVRTAILLRSAVTQIDERAAKLKEDLDFLVKARQEIADREIALRETTDLLDRERRRLGALMSRKKVLKRRADRDAQQAERRIAQLAARAQSVQELLEGIDDVRKDQSAGTNAPENIQTAAAGAARAVPPISQAKGRLNLPAVGRVTGRYGEKTEAGFSRKGVTMVTSGGAQVVSTYNGIAVYAGEFRGYGLLLIIDHGEGYHTLLAGLDRIDVEQGQRVLAGEPVGVMEQATENKPVLYVEIRRDGQPINPIPWLAAKKQDEVNG